MACKAALQAPVLSGSTSLGACASRAPSQAATLPASPFVGRALEKSQSPAAAAPPAPRALTVVAAKRSKFKQGGRQGPLQSQPKLPEFEDDDNVRIVLFVRAPLGIAQWRPISIVEASTPTMKTLVAGTKINWVKDQASVLVTRAVGAAFYRDEDKIRAAALKQHSILRNASKLEYGYKIVDKASPQTAMAGSGVVVIPPEAEVKQNVFDRAKNWFSKTFSGQTS